MRVPLSWVRDLTPVDAEPRAVADALDQLGLEVEAIDAPGEEIRDVRAARTLDVRAHPDADRLRLVDIDYGAGTTTVVCGAPNVVTGMVVAYAGAGAGLPGGVTLERRKIRGQVSDGMLCSARELGLGDDHEGILSLPEEAEPGTDVRDVLGLRDVVFELAITPNRPDAMSIVGVARELAAHFGLPLTVPEPAFEPSGQPTGASITVEVEAVDGAPRFTARRIEVAVGDSPEWMQQRLLLAGMRPISNVVDVTNYVMLERGQPLHAFDLHRLAGPGIVVRRARDGERITTLDGVERLLTADDLLVCDGERAPQAIAGVMGGGASEVHDGTTAVVLEAAYFTPMGISRTSKRLGLRSESSARFERGVDPNGVLAGSARAAELLVAVASGRSAPEPIDRYPVPVERPRIRVRTGRVGAVLGLPLDALQVKGALAPLGIDTEGTGDDFVAIAPTFRPDLEREIDVIEEVGRRVGLDAIPRTLPHTTGQRGGLTVRQRERRLLTDVLVGLGGAEAVTLPLVAEADLEGLGLPLDATVRATNALRADEPVLRPAILPGLLKAAALNAGHGVADVRLFELGHVFAPPRGSGVLPDERDHLAVLVCGAVRRSPVEPDRPVDAYDATDAVHALAAALELADLGLEPGVAPGFVPDRGAAVVVDGNRAGHVGELAPGVLAAFGVPSPAAALELDVDALLSGSRRGRAYRAPSRFPVSTIDLAFVVPDSVSAAEVVTTLLASSPLVEAVRTFDEFRNEALPSGTRSLAFALRYRAPDRTLTDADVTALRRTAIDAVTASHGATLR